MSIRFMIVKAILALTLLAGCSRKDIASAPVAGTSGEDPLSPKVDPSGTPAEYSKALTVRGVYRFDKAMIAEALTDLNEAIKLDDSNGLAYCYRGLCYLEQGKLEDCIRDLEAAIQIDPEIADSYIGLADAKMRSIESKTAESIASDCAARFPNEARAYMMRGRARIQMILDGDTTFSQEDALADINHAIDIVPDSLSFRSLRGYALVDLKMYEEAIADFDFVIERSPGKISPLLSKANSQYRLKQFEDVIATATEVAKLDPKCAEANILIGDCNHDLKKLDLAIASYKRAVEIAPNDFDALNSLAWCYATASDANLRNGQLALSFAKRACEIGKTPDPTGLGTLAAAHAEMGDFARAIELQKQALANSKYEKLYGDKGRECLASYEKKEPFRDN